MAEREFVPFLPRRFARPDSSLSAAEPAAEEATTGVDGIIDSVSPEAVEQPVAQPPGVSQSADDAGAAVDQDDSEPTLRCETHIENVAREVSPIAPVCDHAWEIRNEAVRLASIACGRALRHAVLLHPQIIAAFVDDALRTTGGRTIKRILVHEGLISYVDQHRRFVEGNAELSPGDLVIDVDDGSIGADLETRAELLVAAASES